MPTVFVYGTLKRGGRYHSMLAQQRFVSDARTVPGYTLYRPADYPGMVRSTEDCEGVTGELWEVTSECLRRLDQLEGLNEQLYERVAIALQPPHDTLAVETYLYLRSLDGCPHLGSTWETRQGKS